MARAPSRIQTLIMSKARFRTAAAAKAWARKQGMKAPKVDESAENWRLRQAAPGRFGLMRTITLSKGVQAVIGRLKGAKARRVGT